MAEEQPFTPIPEPSLPASTWSSLESQLDQGKAELKALQEAVCSSAKAHLNIRTGTFRDHVRDRNNMRSFLADCSKHWPKLDRYENGWPALAVLKLLLRFKSQKLFEKPGKRKKYSMTSQRKQIPAPPPSPRAASQVSVQLESKGDIPISSVDGALTAYLQVIDARLSLAQASLHKLGIRGRRAPALIKSLAFLPSRDEWLRSLMQEGVISLKTFQIIRTSLIKHCLVVESEPARFQARFKPTTEDLPKIVSYFLQSITPNLAHLQLSMERLGITTLDDLEAIVESVDRDREFYDKAVKSKLILPIEAVFICHAFSVLAVAGTLSRLRSVEDSTESTI